MMATYTWTGSSGADWSVASDWTPAGGPPGAADTALILAGGTVSISQAQPVDVLGIAAGAIAIIAGGVGFSIAGSLSGGGLLLDQGTLDVAGSAVVLSGGGTVALGGMGDSASIVALTAGNALDNVSDVITGTGMVGGDGLALTNEAGGVIDAASLIAGAATLAVNAGSLAMVNAGLMEATSATLAPTGIIQNDGTIAGNGGTVYLANAAITGGTLATSGSGAIAFVGAEIDGSAAAVTNVGSLAVTALDLLGTLDNTGTVQLVLSGQGTAEIVLDSPTVTLTGGGAMLGPQGATGTALISPANSLDVLVNVNNTITAPGVDITASLTNEAKGVLQGISGGGANSYVLLGGSSVVNAGTIANAIVGSIVNNAEITNSKFDDLVDQFGGGTITSATLSDASVEGGTVDGGAAVAAVSTLDGSTAPIVVQGDVSGAPAGQEGAGATPSGVLDLSGSIENLGTISAASGLVLGFFHPVAGAAGTVSVASPAVTLSGGGQIVAEAGQVETLYLYPGPVLEYVLTKSGTIDASATGDLLVNVDNTISGGGDLGGSGGLAISNETAGIIMGSLEVDPLSLNNAGTVLATGGFLNVNTASLSNTGILKADGGQLVIAGGTFNNESGGLATGGVLTVSTASLDNAGIINADGGQLLISGGTFSNESGGLVTGGGTVQPLSLDNAGTVVATGTQGLTVDTANLTNTGTMEADGGTLLITSGTFATLPVGTWIAENSAIAFPAPTGITAVAGYLVLTGTAAELVSSTGTGIPSLTNSYLAPRTILAGAVIDVVNGAMFGIDRTPPQTIEVGGTTVVTAGSLQPFSNAGQLWLAGGTADLTASVTNTGTLKGTGTFNVSGAVMDNTAGTIEARAGLLTFNGAFSGGDITIDPDSSLELAPGWFASSAAVPAGFGGTNDLLQLDVTDTAGTYSAVGDLAVGNLVYGDTIIVHGSVTAGGTFGGFDTIENDGTTLSFVHAGQTLGALTFAGGTSQLVQNTDANNDAIITVACFAAGTRVLTASGEMPVEDLRPGDVAPALRGGRADCVRWIGQRHAGNARPVRIAAHAFGAGLPHRALLLSPDHAVFVDGVLVPVRTLINGASIAAMEMQGVTWWHVELQRHEVIVAEGLACESYLDTGNRSLFTVEDWVPAFAGMTKGS